MILVPFFASSTVYGSTKNLMSLPFQAPVFFDLSDKYKYEIKQVLIDTYKLVCTST